MPTQEDIVHQQTLLTTYSRNLAHLERQAASYGGEYAAPLHIINSLNDTRANISRIKSILRGWGIKVDDAADDESLSTAPSAQGTDAAQSPVKSTNVGQIPKQTADFVIITALEEERDAVLDKLPKVRRHVPSGSDIRVYYTGELQIESDGSTKIYQLALVSLLGMGRVEAANATSDAIRRWKPRYIIMVGIAGGVAAEGVRLGDILISNQVVDYELQKITADGPQIRWNVYQVNQLILSAVSNFRPSEWVDQIALPRPKPGMPRRHIGPIASGDKVIAFGEALARYRDTWPKLIGVEMEAGGVAKAAFQTVNTPGFFMVRGVSDLADEKKGKAQTEQWRAYACDVAATYTIALLKSGLVAL